jgi:hypothetical protein
MEIFKRKTAEETAKQLIGKGVSPLKTQEVADDHKHQWEMVSKTQAPPRKDVSVAGLEKETADKVLFGVTVFLWECLICHEHQKETVLGSDIPQLDELIDKADHYGPQYIQRLDGQTFVVAKYTLQQQPSSPLPMR